jgi:hypothetical protein
MPNTITAYFDFTPGTKARSSEVNTNFSNYRGTLVPINTNTASASDMTHNLGSSDHRWSVGYFGTLDMKGMTTTTNVVLAPNTSATTGGLDLLFGSTTIASWDQWGLKQDTTPFTSASAPINCILFTGQTTVSFNVDTTASVTLCSARLISRGGGIVEFGIKGYQRATVPLTSNATVEWGVAAYRGLTTTAMTLVGMDVFSFHHGTAASANQTYTTYFPMFYDTGYTGGDNVYELRYIGGTAASTGGTAVATGNFFIKEL